jgi:hypothetical protein
MTTATPAFLQRLQYAAAALLKSVHWCKREPTNEHRKSVVVAF